MTWEEEIREILPVAHRYGVDPQFIAAIRKAENGRPGREFGVLSIPAPTYNDQLIACVKTIRKYIRDYPRNPFVFTKNLEQELRLIYSPEFIAYAGSRYAPVKASNDPDGLNNNWVKNVMKYYSLYSKEIWS